MSHKTRKRSPYPHMSRADVMVWERLRGLGELDASRVEYDVALGGAGAFDINRDENMFGMWEKLLKKRVDAVLWHGPQATLVEVKPVANFSALGQLLGYSFLWQKQRGAALRPLLVAACIECDADLIDVFPLYGVSVVAVPLEQREAAWQAQLALPLRSALR